MATFSPQLFQIVREIGRGATATVYEAIYDGRERYAIKSIERHQLTQREWQNLQREAEIMRALNHPNILKLYHIFESDDHYHFVLEYMPYGELFDHIIARGRYTEADAREIVRQILAGVAYLHSNGIAHRDLKPENLLIGEGGRVVISDFGLSKFFGRGELLQTQCGTSGYVAPEVVMGEVYTNAVDIWTVGVIAYILVSGVPPFFGDEQTMCDAILAASYSFPPQHFAAASDSVKNFISALLIRDPMHRPTAMQALTHPWLTQDAETLRTELALSGSLEQYLHGLRETRG